MLDEESSALRVCEVTHLTYQPYTTGPESARGEGDLEQGGATLDLPRSGPASASELSSFPTGIFEAFYQNFKYTKIPHHIYSFMLHKIYYD